MRGVRERKPGLGLGAGDWGLGIGIGNGDGYDRRREVRNDAKSRFIQNNSTYGNCA